MYPGLSQRTADRIGGGIPINKTAGVVVSRGPCDTTVLATLKAAKPISQRTADRIGGGIAIKKTGSSVLSCPPRDITVLPNRAAAKPVKPIRKLPTATQANQINAILRKANHKDQVTRVSEEKWFAWYPFGHESDPENFQIAIDDFLDCWYAIAGDIDLKANKVIGESSFVIYRADLKGEVAKYSKRKATSKRTKKATKGRSLR